MAFTCTPDEGSPPAFASLPPATRSAVAAYHAFCRACDALARDERTPAAARRAVLAAAEAEIEAAAASDAPCHEPAGTAPLVAATRSLARELSQRRLPLADLRRVLQAVERDMRQRRCRNWSDLMLLCSFRDAPRARFLLDLHGEDPALRRAAEALVVAGRCLAILASCRDDYLARDHVYLPLDWLGRAGVEAEALGRPRAGRALRSVFRQYLDRVDEMLVLARPLGRGLATPALRAEAWLGWMSARRLSRRLRRADPLAGPVALPAWERRLIGWLARRRARSGLPAR